MDTNQITDEPMLEDHLETKPKKRLGVSIKDFEIIGKDNKYDPLGIADENVKMRQVIARHILEDVDKAINDKELMAIALKAMNDNDKMTVAMARLRVDEEANNSTDELAKAIAATVLAETERNRRNSKKDDSYYSFNDTTPRDFDLPKPSRDAVIGETDIGTVVLSEKDIMNSLNQGAPDDDDDEE